jgi:PAS domain S-box-containing protein
MPDTVLIDIKRLADYLKEILDHNFAAEPPSASQISEINELAGLLKRIIDERHESLLRAEQTVIELSLQEQEISDMYARISAIVDNIADGLLVADINGIITRTNKSFNSLFRFRDEDIIGRGIKDAFSDGIADMAEALKECKDRIVSAEITLPGGGIAKATANAIRELVAANGEEARCIGSVIIFRDITHEKQVDQMKTDFISTVSHELRTPLTSILGFAKIIKKKFEDAVMPVIETEDGTVSRAVKQINGNLDIIISEGQRLTKLINDVLDIAKMEAGKTEWKQEIVNIRDVIERAITATTALFEQKGLSLQKDIKHGLPEIIGDNDRLMQVVINLLSNAVKFTGHGSIICSAKRSDNEIIVSVTDSGIGIAVEDQSKVFEKFKQVGDTLTDKPIGTGLGLPICKQIIGHHGGRIWVESEPGKGSTFSFMLPLGIESGVSSRIMDIETLVRQFREQVVAAPLPTGGKTVIVVDDDKAIRKLLRQELEAKEYKVIEAVDGVDAIDKVKTERPDLIILDVMMPGISGFDVAAVIKNDPLTMGMPIIMLSVLEDKERGCRIGVDRYFTKPVNMDELIPEVGSLLSYGASKKKVLVVDEDENNLKTLTEALEAKGYCVVCAANGRECIETALNEMPDMIVVDAFVSEKNDIVKTLKFTKGLENVYFVFVAGNKGRQNIAADKPEKNSL